MLPAACYSLVAAYVGDHDCDAPAAFAYTTFLSKASADQLQAFEAITRGVFMDEQQVQRELQFDFIAPRNNAWLLTGDAGTGKSFVVNAVRRCLMHVCVCAPTGAAAVNVNGRTIDSLYVTGTRLEKRRLVIVDEIGMTSVRQIDRLISLGACRFLFVGDFAQLPPVIADDDERVPGLRTSARLAVTQEVDMIGRGNDGGLFAFEHKIFNATTRLHLTTQHRQRQLQSPSLSLTEKLDLHGALNDLRAGIRSTRLLLLLRVAASRYRQLNDEKKSTILHAFTKRKRVDAWNRKNLAELIARNPESKQFGVTHTTCLKFDRKAQLVPIIDGVFAATMTRVEGIVKVVRESEPEAVQNIIDLPYNDIKTRSQAIEAVNTVLDTCSELDTLDKFQQRTTYSVLTKGRGKTINVSVDDIRRTLRVPSDHVASVRRQIKEEQRQVEKRFEINKQGRSTLYIGQRVVAKANVRKAGVANGNTGVIIDFDTDQPYKDADPFDVVVVRLDDDRVVRVPETIIYTTVPITIGENRHISIVIESRLMPLRAGWALTYHALQGITCARLAISCLQLFQRSFIYVAVSRLTSAGGLFVVDLPRHINRVGQNSRSSDENWYRPHNAYVQWCQSKSLYCKVSFQCYICGVYMTPEYPCATCSHRIARARRQPLQYRKQREKQYNRNKRARNDKVQSGLIKRQCQ